MNIIKDVTPDVIALCETKREDMKTTKKEDEIPGYAVIENNLKKGKEGLLFAAKKGSFKSIREVTESELKNIMTIRVEYPKITIRFILVHAPQETEKLEERSDFFEELDEQIERSCTAGEIPIVVGDLNAKIKCNEEAVCGETSSGKLLCETLQNYKMRVANFHPKADGKWTRIQGMKDGSVKKSALDYILMQDDIYENISEMVIDEEKVHCPYGEKKTGGKKQIIFSDHCAMMLSLKISVGKPHDSTNKMKVWNLNEEGYAKYTEESKAIMDVNYNGQSTQVYANWVHKFEDLLKKCFTKKTVNLGNSAIPQSKQCKKVREILSKLSREGKIQRKVVRGYLERLIEKESNQMAECRAEKLKRTMEQLTEKDKFSPNGFWKAKKAVKKINTTGTTTVVKDNGVEITGDGAIRDAYKDEFKFRLRSREPNVGWEEYVKETNETIRGWLRGESKSGPPFTIN